MVPILTFSNTSTPFYNLVIFFSKFLFPVEHNYEIHDKEMLVIIHALEK